MEKQLPLIVKFEVKEGKIEFVKAELLKLIEPTRKEFGCVQYDLHQDLEDPSIFMFYEIWETEALWVIHNATPHVMGLNIALEGSIEKFTLSKLNLL